MNLDLVKTLNIHDPDHITAARTAHRPGLLGHRESRERAEMSPEFDVIGPAAIDARDRDNHKDVEDERVVFLRGNHHKGSPTGLFPADGPIDVSPDHRSLDEESHAPRLASSHSCVSRQYSSITAGGDDS